MRPLGFVGLGRMGSAMALRLVEAGTPVVVWNRSPEPARLLGSAGADVATTLVEVLDRCRVVVMMLANAQAATEVLSQAPSIVGRVLVNAGTLAPESSLAMHDRVHELGGHYVECPVSGSRVQAEAGALVGMLAGEPAVLDEVEPLLAPMTAAVFRTGSVPRALETKLAVNVFLISLVAGLAESVSFAERRGVDVGVLRSILDAGPMASAVSRIKLAKIVEADWSAQAAVADVHYNSRLIVDAARQVGAPVPLMSVCERLFAAAESVGLGTADMAAVIEAVRAS